MRQLFRTDNESKFAGRRVTVMGLGTFGGGVAVTRFLAAQRAHVTVTDLRTARELSESIAALADLENVRLHLGGHHEADFAQADFVIVNPAVAPDNPFLTLARESGVDITSEIRLFWLRCPARIVGVTGSNGKSTTATLIHDILQRDGRRVWLGGNIGSSLLSVVDEILPDDWVVLELSSFQLANLNFEQLSPHVAVVTSFTPNHLDWHGSQSQYAFDKQSILRWQTADDIVVRRAQTEEARWPTAARTISCGDPDDPGAVAWFDERQQVICFKEQADRIALERFPQLVGRDLRNNALLAATTGLALNVSLNSISEAFTAFKGLPHRRELVSEADGIRFINDSASTTPESTIAAITACNRPPILIAGGTGKGCDIDALAGQIVRSTKAAIIIGSIRDQLLSEIHQQQIVIADTELSATLQHIETADSLAAALTLALKYGTIGDTILFSPGFASGTMFRHFAARGDEFARLVRQRDT